MAKVQIQGSRAALYIPLLALCGCPAVVPIATSLHKGQPDGHANRELLDDPLRRKK